MKKQEAEDRAKFSLIFIPSNRNNKRAQSRGWGYHWEESYLPYNPSHEELPPRKCI